MNNLPPELADLDARLQTAATAARVPADLRRRVLSSVEQNRLSSPASSFAGYVATLAAAVCIALGLAAISRPAGRILRLPPISAVPPQTLEQLHRIALACGASDSDATSIIVAASASSRFSAAPQLQGADPGGFP